MLYILIIIAGIILIYERKITLATTFIFYWMIFCIFSTFFYRYIDMPNKGLIYIMSMVLVFYLGTVFTRNRKIKLFTRSQTIDIKGGDIFLKMAVIAALIAIVISFYRYGYSLYSFSDFLSTSSSVRLTNFGSRSSFEKIAMPFIFSAFALDGYFCAYSISYKAVINKYKTVLPLLFLEIIILGVLSTGKSLLIWAVILWTSGFLSGNQEFLNVKIEKNKLSKFIKKHKWNIIITTVIFILCLMIMMYVRSQKEVETLIYKMINYGLGQVPCFSFWFNEISNSTLQYSNGKQLLFGIFDELKFSDNLFSNFPLNVSLYNKGVYSNIYTVFRCVIEDFGLKGSVLFWFLFGIISGIVEKKIQYNKNIVIYNGLLLAFYIFIFFSFLISAWHYLTIALAQMFFFLELYYIKRIKKRGDKNANI